MTLSPSLAPGGLTNSGRNFSERRAAPAEPAPDLEVILLLLSVTDDAGDEVWNSKDESKFWLWLVRCPDGELESFISNGPRSGPYLEHARAERQCRQREQSKGFRHWQQFPRLAAWGKAIARWAHNPFCSNTSPANSRRSVPASNRPWPSHP